MLRTSYILNRRDDWIWFIALPFAAVAIGLASRQWLSSVALVSFSLLVTTPHHFAGWLRAYGVSEDVKAWRGPLVIGPIVIALSALAGIRWAPMTLLLVAWTWDHQHSIMQQYGFARIYDFKAGTGAPSTARLDFYLNWVLYVNLMIVSPLYSEFWIRELYRFGLPISAESVYVVQNISVTVVCVFLIAYVIHLADSIRRGYSINLIKYLFIASSYFLWYFTAWWSQSVLVATIAHAIMHGVQYIVIVHSSLRKKTGTRRTFTNWLVQPRNIAPFLLMCLLYTVLLQLISGQPLAAFGFGAIDFALDYSAPIPQLGLEGYSTRQAHELFAALLIQGAPMVHYYLDSFIWKVRDENVQAGL
jgi:hypothetical protein